MQSWGRLTGREIVTALHHAGVSEEELRARLDAAARRLDDHYRPVAATVKTSVWCVPEAAAGVLITRLRPDVHGSSRAHGPWVWGMPVGAEGEATDRELDAFVAGPRLGADPLGGFVLVSSESEVGCLRLVTGADLSHTLIRADHDGWSAWSTKGWAALLALGRPPRIEPSRVAEYVIFDQVFGRDELLEGTRLEPEAWCVELRANGATAGFWSPYPERLQPSEASNGDDLRGCLVQEMRRVAGLPNLQLGLTAGRDSTLTALALHDAQAAVSAYSFGRPEWPDVAGAVRTAAALQFPHQVWSHDGSSVVSIERALRLTRWTEGLDTAANLVFSPLDWHGPQDVTLVTGNGGETGRAFYYHDGQSITDIESMVRVVGGGSVEALPVAIAEVVRTRLEEAIESAAEACGEVGARTLDVLYAHNRMRSWAGRTMLPSHARGAVMAFTSARVTETLLALPETSRRDGSGFDAALGALGLTLRHQDQAVSRPSVDSIARRAESVLWRRAGTVRGAYRAAGLLRRFTADHDPLAFEQLRTAYDQVPGTEALLRGALGDGMFEHLWRDVSTRPYARRLLWNGLAVGLLASVT